MQIPNLSGMLRRELLRLDDILNATQQASGRGGQFIVPVADVLH